MLLLLLWVFSINAMQRDPIIEFVPYGDDSSSSIKSEHEELCDFALKPFASYNDDVNKYLRHHLLDILNEIEDSPLLHRQESNVEFVRRIRSSDDTTRHDRDPDRMNQMISKAMCKAFQEKEKQIAAKEEKLKSKFSLKATAAIATVVGIVSTIVSTICSTVVTFKSK